LRISRPVRIALQVLVSAGVLAYLIWQINLGATIDLIGSSNGWYLLASYVIFLVTTVGMAWRWKALLASKGIHEPLSWLTKLYFVGYAAGQVLPTSIGGDTVRIAAHARRRPDAKAEVAGAVLMERVVGSAGTLVLVAMGLVLAIGRYNNIQEILSIWLCGEAVGIDVSPLVYIVMGPLLFLVMLIPFTINGLGVREAFFIAFLGRFGVHADAAFATGFLFYAVTVAASIPGGAIMIWDSLRPALVRPRPQ
jgi:uncharacterized membrane protein YbhN (UPF0104 family)